MVGTPRCGVRGQRGALSLPFLRVNERAEHDINIDIAPLRMPKRARQGANDLETELLPETNRRFVRRNDKVELYRAKSEPARFAQAMLAHAATNSLSARTWRYHERGVCDM